MIYSYFYIGWNWLRYWEQQLVITQLLYSYLLNVVQTYTRKMWLVIMNKICLCYFPQLKYLIKIPPINSFQINSLYVRTVLFIEQIIKKS